MIVEETREIPYTISIAIAAALVSMAQSISKGWRPGLNLVKLIS
jgi:hypothetical protein